MTDDRWLGPIMALGSALIFGASTPFAKLLLGGGTDPGLLAGLLYLGSGCGLAVFWLARRAAGMRPEASLQRTDTPWMLLVILFGGILGPLLLMLGLKVTPATTASLLLNVEGLATMAIAWLVLRENVDRKLLLGALSILTGAILLSWTGGPQAAGWGALMIAAGCICWGIDNNLTRKISGSDPVQIAAIKGLAAGIVNLVIALGQGSVLPSLPVVAISALLGLAGYGLSLVLFVLALRHLGSARTGAYYSVAPFIGAIASILILHDPVTLQLCGAALLMGIGVYLHLAESHGHDHQHEALDHEHRHVHEEHHRQDHGAGDPPGEPHTHRHHHAPLRHKHPHYPDLHHHHRH